MHLNVRPGPSIHFASRNLLFFIRPFDESTEIPHRQAKREIHCREQQHQKQVLAQQTCHKCQPTACMMQVQGNSRVVLCAFLPEAYSQTSESRYEGGENQKEDDVGAQAADEVDETEDAHPEEEEGECGLEGWISVSSGAVVGCVGGSGVVIGSQGCAVGEPEGAKGAEDDEVERVAKYEVENGSDDHQEAAKEEVCAAGVSDVLGRLRTTKIGSGVEKQEEEKTRSTSGSP